MERAMSESKERYKTEVDEMVTEIQTLHNRIDDNRDREIIRTLRREVDEYKRKFVEVSKEITDLRRQRVIDNIYICIYIYIYIYRTKQN